MSLSRICWIRSGDESADEVVAYAARELAAYVRRLCGQEWPVHPQAEFASSPSTAWLGVCDQLPAGALAPAPWDDGFAFWAGDGSLFVAGRNARSVLFGVYAFLETQGVHFVFPRVDGEVIPRIAAVSLPPTPVVEQAHYRHRGVCIEGATSLEHALGMVDWCAKKRMNTVFLQFLSSRYFYNQWYERRYNPDHAVESLSEQEALALDEQVIAAIHKRGLVFHRVGHGWTGAAVGLPRSGWVTADEPVSPDKVRWLAQVDGKRELFHGIPINTELCYSHPPAFAALIETIVQYCEQHPELDVVHLWLSDATNNKCECAECQKLSISDWYAQIINALSVELKSRVPQTRFVFLCYIELLWPPEKIDIQADNAILMFAPIARCYGHALADAACDDGQPWPRPPINQFAASRHNAFYLDVLRGWRARFSGDSFDFDYHLMWANWLQLTDTVQARIIHRDLQDLKRLGLDGILSCQSFRAFYPSGLAMAALAEALWNPSISFEALRAHYLDAAFGPNAGFAGEYLDQVEALTDTGDPHRRALPFSNADQAGLERAAAVLHKATVEMPARRASTVESTHGRALDLLAHHARLLQCIVDAYQARLRGEDGEAELDRAGEFLRSTEEPYSHYIDTMLALRFCVERHRA